MADRPLRIGGVEPFSTVDFPGHLATVVFCQGCPLACGYCHNPDLIPPTAERMLDFDTVVAAVEARRGFIDGGATGARLGAAIRVEAELQAQAVDLGSR